MKKYLRWLLVTVAITGILLLSAGIISKKSSESKIALKVARLPPATFTTLLDASFNLADLENGKAVMVMFFAPDCDHCQHAAEELRRNRNELEQYIIVMISEGAKSEVAAFASRYQLDQMKNIILLLDREEQAQQALGLNVVPSYLLYDQQQRLIKKIVGEATMELIIKTFKQGYAIGKKTS